VEHFGAFVMCILAKLLGTCCFVYSSFGNLHNLVMYI